MRMSIFNKANKLKELVVFEGESMDKKRNFFDVDGKKLVISFNGKYHFVESCTCTHCSLFQGLDDKVLCSYRIALLKALPLKQELFDMKIKVDKSLKKGEFRLENEQTI